MRTTSTRTRTRQQVERDRVSAKRHLEGYRLMFNIAQEKGMEYEQERILTSISEYTAEVEYLTVELAGCTR